ncbi:MAG: hypothetical protein CMJ83_00790 [Planctomycetes bacterium]|nr:hypothetical protein [Planctomycetota bacterium]
MTRWVLALVGVLVVTTSASAWWMWTNGFFCRPPAAEAALFRLYALDFLEPLESEGAGGFLRQLHSHRSPRGPLLAGVGALIAHLGGGLTPVVLWVTTTFFGILFLVGTWRLALGFVPPRAALAVTTIVAFSPAVMTMSRVFRPQIAAAALTVWALAALSRSRLLTSRRHAVALGAFTALATLGKVMAPIYVVGGVAAALLAAQLQPEEVRKASRRGAVISLLVFLAVCGWWLLPNLEAVLEYTAQASRGVRPWDMPAAPSRWEVERWTWYGIGFVNNAQGFLVAAVAGLVIPFVLRGRRGSGRARFAADGSGWILLVAVVTGYVALTLGHLGSAGKFSMTFVPLVTLAAMAGLRRIRWAFVRGVAAVLLAVAALTTGVLGHRPFSDPVTLVRWHSFQVLSGGDTHVSAPARWLGLSPSSTGEEWPIREFVRTIAAESSSAGRPLRVLTPHQYINFPNLLYAARCLGVHGTIAEGDWNAVREKRLLEAVRSTDLLVLDTAVLDWDRSRKALLAHSVRLDVLVETRVTSKSVVRLVRVVDP